jgi:hypothetical protein
VRRIRDPGRRVLHPSDVGSEEVDAVAVEVATCAIIVLDSAWIGMAGEDLRVAQRDTGVKGVGDSAMPQRMGLMCRGITATLAIRATIR